MIKNREITDPTRWRLYVTKIANTFKQSQEIKEDLIQEGYIAVWKASLAFKGDNEKDWINYMSTAIINGMKAYLIKYSNTIRTPIKLIGQDNLIKVTSLNTPINENGDILEHLIPSMEEDEAEDTSALKMVIMSLKKDTHKKYLMMWLGVDENWNEVDKMTFQQIADIEGVSKQNIEEIIKKILKKIKNDERIFKAYQIIK